MNLSYRIEINSLGLASSIATRELINPAERDYNKIKEFIESLASLCNQNGTGRYFTSYSQIYALSRVLEKKLGGIGSSEELQKSLNVIFQNKEGKSSEGLVIFFRKLSVECTQLSHNIDLEKLLSPPTQGVLDLVRKVR